MDQAQIQKILGLIEGRVIDMGEEQEDLEKEEEEDSLIPSGPQGYDLMDEIQQQDNKPERDNIAPWFHSYILYQSLKKSGTNEESRLLECRNSLNERYDCLKHLNFARWNNGKLKVDGFERRILIHWNSEDDESLWNYLSQFTDDESGIRMFQYQTNLTKKEDGCFQKFKRVLKDNFPCGQLTSSRFFNRWTVGIILFCFIIKLVSSKPTQKNGEIRPQAQLFLQYSWQDIWNTLGLWAGVKESLTA